MHLENDLNINSELEDLIDWVTPDEVQGMFNRIKSAAASLGMDMARNQRVPSQLAWAYEDWRTNFLNDYAAFTDGSWWSRNFSSNKDTAERYQNDIAEWQNKYATAAQVPPTGPALDTVTVGGEGPAETLKAISSSIATPLRWVLGIGVLFVGYKVYQDFK